MSSYTVLSIPKDISLYESAAQDFWQELSRALEKPSKEPLILWQPAAVGDSSRSWLLELESSLWREELTQRIEHIAHLTEKLQARPSIYLSLGSTLGSWSELALSARHRVFSDRHILFGSKDAELGLIPPLGFWAQTWEVFKRKNLNPLISPWEATKVVQAGFALGIYSEFQAFTPEKVADFLPQLLRLAEKSPIHHLTDLSKVGPALGALELRPKIYDSLLKGIKDQSLSGTGIKKALIATFAQRAFGRTYKYSLGRADPPKINKIQSLWIDARHIVPPLDLILGLNPRQPKVFFAPKLERIAMVLETLALKIEKRKLKESFKDSWPFLHWAQRESPPKAELALIWPSAYAVEIFAPSLSPVKLRALPPASRGYWQFELRLSHVSAEAIHWDSLKSLKLQLILSQHPAGEFVSDLVRDLFIGASLELYRAGLFRWDDWFQELKKAHWYFAAKSDSWKLYFDLRKTPLWKSWSHLGPNPEYLLDFEKSRPPKPKTEALSRIELQMFLYALAEFLIFQCYERTWVRHLTEAKLLVKEALGLPVAWNPSLEFPGASHKRINTLAPVFFQWLSSRPNL